jgi:hypothetical protein
VKGKQVQFVLDEGKLEVVLASGNHSLLFGCHLVVFFIHPVGVVLAVNGPKNLMDFVEENGSQQDNLIDIEAHSLQNF